MSMRELVSVVAKALVDHPDTVNVTEQSNDRAITIKLAVDPSDMGKVIGKDGKTAQAIRTLMIAAFAKGGRRISLDIVG